MWTRWCFGGRIASPFSFSLAVELTCSCRRLGRVPCPGGIHLQEGHFFHSVSSRSVRKHPPGAWVYSFKVQNASYCEARGEKPGFQFFSSSSSSPHPPHIITILLINSQTSIVSCYLEYYIPLFFLFPLLTQTLLGIKDSHKFMFCLSPVMSI